MRVVSIHQPNFIPWSAYFKKMALCDIFVILTECQFEKNGYQNRFKYLDRWHTMAVNKGLEPIKNKRYVSPQEDWQKIEENIRSPLLQDLYQFVSPSLVDTNVGIIKYLAKILKLDCEIVLDYPTSLKGTARLVDLCKHYNADIYIAGVGGKEYLEERLFTDTDIEVQYQKEEDVKNGKAIIEYLQELYAQ